MTRIVQVDAFTDRAFAGNPAAVCILPKAPSEAWLRNVAREMNLSETAFLVKKADGVWDLRWLTPNREVDLCGHATVAAAHVLWEDGHIPVKESARFDTRSGRLGARRDGAWIELDFPLDALKPTAAPDGLVKALGVTPVATFSSGSDHVVELADEKTLRSLAPDLGYVATLGTRGLVVTSPSDSTRYDYLCRYFAPAYGIPEDPATGSIQCGLGPYWAAKLGKTTLRVHQASERGADMRVTPDGARVRIAGQAVTVARLELVGAAAL